MNQQQIAAFLQTVEIFHELAPENLARVAQAAREDHFHADESLMESSTDAGELCVLLEGEAIEFIEQEDCGIEVQARRLYAGESFGIETIVVPSPSRRRVTAVASGRVIRIARQPIDELLGESIVFSGTVCRLLAARLHRSHEQMSAVRFVHLSSFPDIESTMTLLPRRISSVSRSLVVERKGDRVTVAMVNPSDMGARSFIEDALREYHVQFAAISEDDFERLGRKLLGERIERGPNEPAFDRMLYQDTEGVLRPLAGSHEDDLLSHLVTAALRRGASDIHFEPYQGRARVRLRIDGRMVVLEQDITAEVYRHLLARLKVLAELDTTRARRPQDGRFLLEVDDQPIEFRVSASPCHGGEKVVVRIIAANRQFADLSRVILHPAFERMALEMFSNPSGMILVTGPSGAGKTTTLYAALRSIIGPNVSRNVVTLEDPVEYDLPFATQIQVHEETGMGFADMLRSVLRQDPDVILVGEIRDRASAAIAAEAATTGHLVLSSLHTYSALDAVVRLRDLQVPTYAIAAGLRGVITQQLVPRLDPGFTEPVPMDDPFVQRLVDLEVLDAQWNNPLLRGRDEPGGPVGGESGRVAICEMLSVTPALSAAIESSATRAEMGECLDSSCFGAFRDYGRFLLRQGIVAPERILEAMPRGAVRLRYDKSHLLDPSESSETADLADSLDQEFSSQQ